MKLLIVSGVGGHFAPALSLIEALPEGWEYLLVGRKYAFEADKTLSLEYQVAEQKNLPFRAIMSGRLQRRFSRQTIPSLLKIPVGFIQAVKLIREYKPDVIMSFGGYVALPIAQAGRLLHIPIVIHEQTLGAGLANRMVGQFAKKICLSWEQSEQFFPREKIVLTGNPIRKEFLEHIAQKKKHKKKQPTVLITDVTVEPHG